MLMYRIASGHTSVMTWSGGEEGVRVKAIHLQHIIQTMNSTMETDVYTTVLVVQTNYS